MKEVSARITLKIVRSFGFGFVILSPEHNGFCVELMLGCVVVMLRNRAVEWFSLENYFND